MKARTTDTGRTAKAPRDDARLQALVRAQDGLVTRRQALAHGWTRSALRHRVHSGRWQVLLPGVLQTTTGTPTHRQRRRAALLYAGPAAILAAETACAVHGLMDRPADAPIVVVVPHFLRVTAVRGVVVIRTTRTTWRCTVDGLPVSPPARAVTDACLAMPRLDDVRALVARAVQARAVTLEQLGRELDAAPRRGSAHLRDALEEAVGGAASVPEARFLRALRRVPGCPPYELNVDVYDDNGAWLARPDVVFRAQRVIVEIDGARFHLSPERWAADVARHTRLEAAGWTVLRYPAARVFADAGGVCAEVLAVVRKRAA
ncbi:MAG TPA: type IV toxin-antitoxin system AbiEi family antitoxin domain-containing protein [Mycobacteriales bacterium]|nr:type IV toxin-antitoxin system AbiEi family antitoxin domain-containing protein [Mycobacteriales bacterium]